MHNRLMEVFRGIDSLVGNPPEDAPDAPGIMKIFPVGADVTAVEAPFATYTIIGPTPVLVMSGAVHHYTASFVYDFLADTYDEALEIAKKAQELLCCADLPGLIRLDIKAPQADFYTPKLQLYVKRLQIEMDWW